MAGGAHLPPSVRLAASRTSIPNIVKTTMMIPEASMICPLVERSGLLSGLVCGRGKREQPACRRIMKKADGSKPPIIQVITVSLRRRPASRANAGLRFVI